MSLNIGQEENNYKSVFKHLLDNFITSGVGAGGISGTFIEGYPDQDRINRVRFPDEFLNETASVASKHIGMPIISFDEGPANRSTLELGTTASQINQTFSLSIFATSSIERKRLVNLALHFLLDKSITKLDYSNDYDNPTSVGSLTIDRAVRSFPVKSTSIENISSSKIMRERQEIIFNIIDK